MMEIKPPSRDVFVHPQGICETQKVGPGTRIWAFAHVLSGASLGADCNVCDHVFIENDVVIGDRVTIKSGVQLWDGVRLGDDVFIGPNATFTNDRFPRSKHRPANFLRTMVRRGASIGANATILPGITVGEGALVAAGSVVTRDVPARVLVRGNPARPVEFLDVQSWESKSRVVPCEILPGVEFHRLPVTDFSCSLPFKAQHLFAIDAAAKDSSSAHHACAKSQQFVVLLSGSVTVLVDNAQARVTLQLKSIGEALLLPPGVWTGYLGFAPGTTVCVFVAKAGLASRRIQIYQEFLDDFAKP